MKIIASDMLAYTNAKVISRYRKEYPNARFSAEETFADLMRYFWLCKKHESDKICLPNNDTLDFRCVMHVEMEEIDNMWHTFLLFTRDYHAFCHRYFEGIFFHHDPISETTNISKEAYEEELQRYLTYIYDSLGEEVVIRWFRV